MRKWLFKLLPLAVMLYCVSARGDTAAPAQEGPRQTLSKKFDRASIERDGLIATVRYFVERDEQIEKRLKVLEGRHGLRTGVATVTNEDQWSPIPELSGGLRRRVHVAFDPPFGQAPNASDIIVGFRRLSIVHGGDTLIETNIDAASIKRDGCDVLIATWSGTTWRHVEVSWCAYGVEVDGH